MNWVPGESFHGSDCWVFMILSEGCRKMGYGDKGKKEGDELQKGKHGGD